MAVEQYTESLTLKEMKCVIGKNPFGYVLPQGDVLIYTKLKIYLRKQVENQKNVILRIIPREGKGRLSQNIL